MLALLQHFVLRPQRFHVFVLALKMGFQAGPGRRLDGPLIARVTNVDPLRKSAVDVPSNLEVMMDSIPTVEVGSACPALDGVRGPENCVPVLLAGPLGARYHCAIA